MMSFLTNQTAKIVEIGIKIVDIPEEQNSLQPGVQINPIILDSHAYSIRHKKYMFFCHTCTY